MAGQDRLTELAATLGGRLVLPEGPVTVALSGGADSAALLWLLVGRGIDVSAVHVYHGLPASSLMSTAAGQVAAGCGVRMEMAVVEPAGVSELQLREARIAALLERSGDRPVLMAHTADDQAETVLMRVLRGTGVEGLGGIPLRSGRIWHPMLEVTRQETRLLATLATLPFRDDPANEDRSVLRNRVRNDVLPVIEEALGRSPRPALSRLAASAAEDSGVLEQLARRIPVERRRGSVRLPIGAMLAMGEVVSSRALRRACTSVAGPYPPDRAATARLLDVAFGRAAAAEVGPGLRARSVGPHLVIGPAGESPLEQSPPTPLTGGRVRWSEWMFGVERGLGPRVSPLSARSHVAPEGAGRWEVRNWHPEDRVTGRRVDDALRDAAVPAAERAGWPLVTCAGEPVWIPGVRGRVWPTHDPGGYLSLVAVREPSWQPSEP